MGKMSQAYLTGPIGLPREAHILRHIFPARNSDFPRSEVHLVRVVKTKEGYELVFGNVSALFRLVLKVYYDFCQLLLFRSDHNEIRAARQREKSQAKGSSNKSRLVV
jgi:hypothetical protein